MASVKLVAEKKPFNPVKIAIKLATQDELDLMGTMFNHGGVDRTGKACGAPGLFRGTSNADIFAEAGADMHRITDLDEAIKKFEN